MIAGQLIAVLAAAACSPGHAYAFGDIHRVYAAPGGGCVWLRRPDGSYWSIGPELHGRLGGNSDGVALPRDPIGEAAAVCGFSSFTVRWPTFIVTAHRVAWGDGTGCHELTGTSAVVWIGHFVRHPREGRRPPRWDAVLDASSPPLAAPQVGA